jgi:predicted NACHT family NTPase
MAIIELSIVVSAIVEMGVEAVWDKTKRREAVIKVLRKAGLKPDAAPTDFDGIYAYTLVEYGIWKPQPLLDFFRNEFIRNAFRQSFETRDPAVLQTEAEGLIEWNRVGEDLRRLDIDPRREFARFTAVFNEIVDRARTPAEVRRDQKLDDIYGDLHQKTDEILERFDKLTQLDDIREELSRLADSSQARQFVLTPSGDKLKVFISSKMGELRDVREIVTQSLLDRGIDAWVYEARAGARPDDVVLASLSEVEAADIYVGLFWREYGDVTAKEYRHARALHKPCFVYIRDKDLARDGSLEEFFRTDVYDLRAGVCYDYFDSAARLASQVGDDIMAWLVRQHREMSAAIQAAQVSATEIERLQTEVDRLQAVSHNPLPDGTPADYLASQMRPWFETLGYRFESHSVHTEAHFEWIIDVPARHGYDRILVVGVEGEADLADVQALRLAVDAQRCDEGWLVAMRRISQLARNEVSEKDNRDLFCYTFDELLDEHADFSRYLDWLEHEVTRLGIDRMYVPLACVKEEFDPITKERMGRSRYDEHNGWIDGYIDRWLDDPSKEHVSVLGEFGTGKTWFALHYAWVALQRYREAKRRGTERPRLPLVIPLRDYAKAVSVESLFSEFFFRKHEIPLPGYSAFEQLDRMGKFLLIFDGFDEMAAKIDRQKMINNFWELARVVVPGAKAILTCRTEHFPEATEGRALLGAQLQASTAKLTGEPPQFEVLELEKFDDSQIREVLSFQANPSTVARVMSDPQLLDLARRPIMTEYILEALPDIEAGRPVDLSRVYLYAVRRKMERDIRSERTFTSLADKLYFLCELSWEMLSTDQLSLNYRVFPNRLHRLFGPIVKDQRDLDHWHYDMMGQTMLVRNAEGDYAPAHRSLLEFFVAYKLGAQMGALAPDFVELARSQSHIDLDMIPRDYTWSTYFERGMDETGPARIAPLREFARESFEELAPTVGAQRLPPTIVTLMKGMVVYERLYDLVQATCHQDLEQVLYSGGNAATLIQTLGGGFENADLARANLAGAWLDGCNFRGANLQFAVLREAHMDRTQLGRANLVGSDLRDAFLHQCWAEDTDFRHIHVAPYTILVTVGDWAQLLPEGSTLIDAAVHVHSHLALRCTGGSINGRPAPVDEQLSHLSRAWIETNPDSYTATPEWLGFVQTSFARSVIVRHFLRLLGPAAQKLMPELRRFCEAEQHHHIVLNHLRTPTPPRNALFGLLLRATVPNLDATYSQLPDLLDNPLLLGQVVNDMKACLARYNQLLYSLVRARVVRKKPRSNATVWYHLDWPPLLSALQVDSIETLIMRVLRGEVDPDLIANTLAELLSDTLRPFDYYSSRYYNETLSPRNSFFFVGGDVRGTQPY